MSEKTEKTEITLPFMSETDIAKLSVSALSNRPNEHSGQYGRKGLTPEELKEAFSKLPVAIAARMNELLPLIRQKLLESDANITEICNIINDVIKGLDSKVDKMSGHGMYPTVYAVGADGSDGMIQVRSTVAKGAIVAYGEDNSFNVAAPSSNSHPVNKGFFDSKVKNSLYTEVTDMERRMQALEHSANGSIYGTKTVKGNAAAVQVDNACTYGILSRIGGNVAKVTVGTPFDLNGASVFKNNSTYGECKVKGNSVIFRKGGTYGVQIPCDLPSGASVTVNAKSIAVDSRDKISHYILVDSNGSTVSSQSTIGTSVTVTAGKTAAYVLLYKENKTTALYDDLEICDVRVLLNTPSEGNVMRVVDEIGIPEEIRSLDGYGTDGAYLDLTERKFYDASGAATDVSAYVSDESDVVSLLPSALIEFTDVSGNRVSATYELSYKNKI